MDARTHRLQEVKPARPDGRGILNTGRKFAPTSCARSILKHLVLKARPTGARQNVTGACVKRSLLAPRTEGTIAKAGPGICIFGSPLCTHGS